MKISRKNQTDIRFYLRNRHFLAFSGSNESIDIVAQRNGASFIEAFVARDTHGRRMPTRHPRALGVLLKAKASANLHIKTYAQSRVEGTMSLLELRAICIAAHAPDWVRNGVEESKARMRSLGMKMIGE